MTSGFAAFVEGVSAALVSRNQSQGNGEWGHHLGMSAELFHSLIVSQYGLESAHAEDSKRVVN